MGINFAGMSPLAVRAEATLAAETVTLLPNRGAMTVIDSAV